MLRRVLKSCWRSLPQARRELLLAWLARLSLGLGVSAPANPAGPLYVVGLFRLPCGLGEGARLYYRQHQDAGENVIAVDYTHLFEHPVDGLAEMPLLPIEAMRARLGPGTVSIHCNPPHFFFVLLKLGRRCLRGKWLVPYWAWELEDIPNIWRKALRHAHAVEVPSSFTAGAILRHTSVPVRVVPHPVHVSEKRTRAFAADGVTRVLFVFDITSRLSRKNPLGAIDAFRKAFGQRQDVLFTLKVTPSPLHQADLAALRAAVTGSPNISFIERYLTNTELSELYDSCDIYLSMHRSEGFGLTIREAMLHGLHVVATGWSGNMDFMHGPRTHPVRYDLVPIDEDTGFFHLADARWAQPDVEHAARILTSIDLASRQ